MAKKKPTKAEQELKRALKNFRERVRYWKKKGYNYTGPTPKTAKGLNNVTAKKIKTEKYKDPEFTERPKYPKVPKDYDDDYDDFYDGGYWNEDAEARELLDRILAYLYDAEPEDSPMNGFTLGYIEKVQESISNLINSAIHHYGEDNLGKWLIESGAGEQIFDLIDRAVNDYKDPSAYLAELGTLLNGGPLTQEQSESLTENGVFNFSEDELY